MKSGLLCAGVILHLIDNELQSQSNNIPGSVRKPPITTTIKKNSKNPTENKYFIKFGWVESKSMKKGAERKVVIQTLSGYFQYSYLSVGGFTNFSIAYQLAPNLSCNLQCWKFKCNHFI